MSFSKGCVSHFRSQHGVQRAQRRALDTMLASKMLTQRALDAVRAPPGTTLSDRQEHARAGTYSKVHRNKWRLSRESVGL